MKIILDAMGGDNAPEAPVLGAVEAAKTYGIEIVLVGRGEDILAVLKKHGIDNLPEGMEISMPTMWWTCMTIPHPSSTSGRILPW